MHGRTGAGTLGGTGAGRACLVQIGEAEDLQQGVAPTVVHRPTVEPAQALVRRVKHRGEDGVIRGVLGAVLAGVFVRAGQRVAAPGQDVGSPPGHREPEGLS
jgi:hypothetical protein